MKTELYINGVGCVSRLKGFEELLDETHQPNYKELIPAMKLRRMSKVMRMSNYAALTALSQANVEIPQAINVGTGYGCLVDTEKFLSTLLDNNEEFSNPSAFINSTHNTLAGSLAILLGAKGQNFTFVHPENAFENALIDAQMGMDEGSFSDALLGGVDEKTDILQSLSSHFVDSEIGEGAAFLSVTNKPLGNSKALIKGVMTDSSKMNETLFLEKFFQEMQLKKTDLDFVLSNAEIGTQSSIIDYKKLIGDYPTITAFACAFAATIIERQQTPLFLKMPEKNINNILVYNRYQNGSQSLILISKIA